MKSEKQPFDLYAFYRQWFSDHVSDETVAWVASHSRVETKEKGEIFFGPTVDDSPVFYLLLDGIVKTYVISPDGVENTYAIYDKPGFSMSMTTQMINETGLYMKALTPCKVIHLIGTGPFDVAEKFPDLWRELTFGFMLYFTRMMDKLRAGYTLSAKERYLWFLNTYPDVADKISQVEVANFLGIKPQSLSRIRSELEEESIEVTPPPQKITYRALPRFTEPGFHYFSRMIKMLLFLWIIFANVNDFRLIPFYINTIHVFKYTYLCTVCI